MADFFGTIIFSVVMGFSIYLSLPIVLRKKTSERITRLLNSVAIGILVFLMCDIFSDVASSLYSGGSLAGYGANLFLSAVFAAALFVGFFMLYYFENRNKSGIGPSPMRMSLMIAIGIGLQNLTEGLVFGSLSVSLGLLSGAALVVLIGFILQNMTEGFPIAAPFLNHDQKRLGTMLLLFLVGGLPTVIGGAVGYYYSSTTFNILFDGLAIGAILYVILPMIKHQIRDIDNMKQRLVYAGIFLGFIVGFLVNLI
jgi:ZIP family zinc transporter